MNIYHKYLSIFVVGLLVILFLSTNALTSTDFYILSNDSTQKIYCDSLEINNNQAFCNSDNLLITYDIAQIKTIEVVRKGTSQYFRNFTRETTNIINELNSDKSTPKKMGEQNDNTKKILDPVLGYTQFLLNNFKSQSGNNSFRTILLISGFIVFLIGSVIFLLATFREGILWGLSCMFLPFVSFVFLFVHWRTAAKPFLVSMVGIAILFLSTIFSPTAGTGRDIAKFKSITNHVTNTTFQCSGKIYCSEMSSCAEAKFYLRNCPGTKMDGNNDGIPCEKQWCGN